MRFSILLVIVGFLCGCTKSVPLQSFEGMAQGTTYHIRFWSDEEKDLSSIKSAATQELANIDAAISNYRINSVIERFNQSTELSPYEVGAEIVNLVQRARGVSEASHGCYDLTIKPLFDLWGFNSDTFKPATPEKIKELMKFVGINQIRIIDATHLQKTAAEVRVDLSSIGQGYSVARLTQILERYGINNYMVEIGGELQTKGSKPNKEAWRIALEKPLPGQQRLQKVINIANTQNVAVMTSGTYRHYFDDQGVRYSHILDARTGRSVTHATVSATVIFPDATMADAWSTALLCLGREEGLEIANQWGIPVLFIDQHESELIETLSEPLKKFEGITIQ